MLKIVPKGWGQEEWIVNNDKYCGKLLYLNTGAKVSLHYHKNKDETFYVRFGKVIVGYYDDPELDGNFTHWASCDVFKEKGIQCVELGPGDVFHVPAGRRHAIYSASSHESCIIEFSTHHEDSDSYRILKGD